LAGVPKVGDVVDAEKLQALPDRRKQRSEAAVAARVEQVGQAVAVQIEEAEVRRVVASADRAVDPRADDPEEADRGFAGYALERVVGTREAVAGAARPGAGEYLAPRLRRTAAGE